MTYIPDILLYSGCIAFFFVLPGVCLVPEKNRACLADLIPLAFTMSCVVLVSTYFISFFFKSVWPLFIIPLMFSYVSLFKLKWRMINVKSIHGVLSGKELLLLGLILIYVICFSILPNLPITEDIAKSYHADQVWHMGNVNMFCNFSMEDVRFSGITFRYHYFNDVLIACAKLITRISTFNLVFYYFPITVILILFLSLKSIASIFLDEDLRLRYIWLVIGSTCASSILSLWFRDGAFVNTLSPHIYTNVNAVACGWIFMLSYVVLLFKNEVHKNDSWRIALILGIVVALCAGTKGPFGFILIAATLFSYLLMAFRKETRCWKVPLCSLVAFVIVYKLLLSSGSGSLSFSLCAIFDASNACILLNPFRFGSVLNNVLRVVAIPVYFVFLFFGASLFYIAGLYKQAKLFPKNSFENLFFHGAVGVGLILFFTLDHSGRSQMYFFFGAVPFIAVLSLQFYQDVFKSKIARYVFMIGFCVAVSTPIFSSIKRVMDNRVELKKRFFDTETGCMEIRPDMLTYEETEGLEWLKENSEQSDLFLTNRMSLDYPAEENPKWFYYSAFSERPCYLEGYAYLRLDAKIIEEKMKLIRSVFSDKVSFVGDALRGQGIRYIVEYKVNESTRKVSPDVGLLKFSNLRMNIYKVK